MSFRITRANLHFSRPTKFSRPIRFIVLHHAAWEGQHATPLGIHDVHLKAERLSGTGAEYHFYVRLNGDIFALRPTNQVGLHCGVPSINRESLAICFEGRYHLPNATMPTVQLHAGAHIISHLQAAHNVPNNRITTHRLAQVAAGLSGASICPGSRFPLTALIQASEMVPQPSRPPVTINGDPIAVGATTTVGGTTVPAGPQHHVVTRGETMSGIARAAGVTMQSLLALNPHKAANPGQISVGEVLIVPTTTASQAAAAADGQSQQASALLQLAQDFARTTMREEERLALSAQYNRERASITHQTNIARSNTTLRGGKQKMDWETRDFVLPGYRNATLVIEAPTRTGTERKTIEFLISPSSFSDNRSNSLQASQTSAGWFMYRLGPALTQISLSGHMLDTRHEMERHAFLQDYKRFIIDRRSRNHEFINENTVSVFIEGIQYIGYLTSLSFSKTGAQQFLYQYAMQFLVVEERSAYSSESALLPAASQAQPAKITLMRNVGATLLSGQQLVSQSRVSTPFRTGQTPWIIDNSGGNSFTMN